MNLPEPGPGDVVAEAVASCVSRGTERLVLAGEVPESEFARMRCPFQEGAFPFPVKYGYQWVGVVRAGPAELIGRTVFVLHPHQSRIVVPAASVHAVPHGVPAQRATLGANMETALNVIWDAQLTLGDRLLVVGAGVLGLLIARLAAQMPGVEVTVVDIDPAREADAVALGARFASTPPEVRHGFDVAINVSASASGLQSAIDATGRDGRVVEASWHGASPVAISLGGVFHSRRITLASSQVGHVPPARAPRWSLARRLQMALGLLSDPALDRLITHAVDFSDAPVQVPSLMAPGSGALAITIRYPAGG